MPNKSLSRSRKPPSAKPAPHELLRPSWYSAEQWLTIVATTEEAPTRKRKALLEEIVGIASTYRTVQSAHAKFMDIDFREVGRRLVSLADSISALLPDDSDEQQGKFNMLEYLLRQEVGDALTSRTVRFPSPELRLKVLALREGLYIQALEHLVSLLRHITADLESTKKQDRASYRGEKFVLTHNSILVGYAAELLKKWSQMTGRPVGIARNYDTETAKQHVDGPSVRLLHAVFGPLTKDAGSFEAVLKEARKQL